MMNSQLSQRQLSPLSDCPNGMFKKIFLPRNEILDGSDNTFEMTFSSMIETYP